MGCNFISYIRTRTHPLNVHQCQAYQCTCTRSVFNDWGTKAQKCFVSCSINLYCVVRYLFYFYYTSIWLCLRYYCVEIMKLVIDNNYNVAIRETDQCQFEETNEVLV